LRAEETRPTMSIAVGCAVMVCAVAALLGWCAGASGVILHPAGEPNLAVWQDRPPTAVIGRWGSNASCVVVSPNCIVTTRHQGGSTATVVRVDGVAYGIDRIWNHPRADLRVVRLLGAAFNDFVDLYDAGGEIGRSVVIGGYGLIRGLELVTGGTVYGYSWQATGNTVLRMGTNRIDSIPAPASGDAYTSEILAADFDGLGSGFATQYECTVARHDSGGGWFIKRDGQWRLAGLSRSIEAHYAEGHEDDPNYILEQSWFRNRGQPELPDPDYLDAVRIGPYADWIRMALGSPMPGDLNEDLRVDFADAAILGLHWGRTDCAAPDFCGRADFEPDGDVDFDDLAWLAVHWLTPGLDP